MPNDRGKLEEHIEALLDSIEKDAGGADWQVENICTVMEVIVTRDGETRVGIRKRQTGRPASLVGLLRYAEEDVLGDLLRASIAQAEAAAQSSEP